MTDNKVAIVAFLQSRGYAVSDISTDYEVTVAVNDVVRSSEQLQTEVGRQISRHITESTADFRTQWEQTARRLVQDGLMRKPCVLPFRLGQK